MTMREISDTLTKKKAIVFFGIIAAIMAVVTIFPPTGVPAWACGRCWNVTAGETIATIGIDQTGKDAGYAIPMQCTTLNKPDPPGSTLNLACEETPNGLTIGYTEDVRGK